MSSRCYRNKAEITNQKTLKKSSVITFSAKTEGNNIRVLDLGHSHVVISDVRAFCGFKKQKEKHNKKQNKRLHPSATE